VWFDENELLLKPDKSDIMFIETSTVLCAAKNELTNTRRDEKTGV